MEKTQKMRLGLFQKILLGYIIAVITIGVITGMIVHSARNFSSDANEANVEILPNTLKAKDLQLHVIQVQQWLTDISATRGAPGYDDGYDEAADHAEQFYSIVEEFKSFYRKNSQNDKVRELEDMKKAFDGYYDMGKQMAAAYIEYGPDEGNEFMEKFDPYAEEISEMVDAFVNDLSDKLTEIVSEISKESDAMVIQTILIGFFAAVLLFTIGFVLSRRITNPINQFTRILKDISEGEGDLTKRIHLSSSDEIGDMASYFNNTFEKIRVLVATVQEQSVTLSNVGADLSANMTETASAVNEISANIKSIKGQTVNQSASVTETSSTMDQISLGIGKLNELIKEQAKKITESSGAISFLIQNMDSATQTLIKNSENIKQLTSNSESGKAALDRITTAIQEVAEESRGLMEISNVIQSIAEETNLLAMNAAIEAAHAGDTGKGFAVVADEVRKLAESSAAQTKTIEAALTKITNSINVVIEFSSEVVEKFVSIEREVQNVSQQEESVRLTMEEQSASSKTVLESINILNEISMNVQRSSVEMLDGSSQVSREARNMTAITEEISGGMNEMASGADQITEAVNTVNMLANDTKVSIEALTAEVKKFKVE